MTQVKSNADVKEFIPRSFTDIIDNFFNETVQNSTAVNFLPRVDITESEKQYEIELALPGLKKEEIKIDFQEGKLTVSGERKFEKEEGKKYHTIESQFGAFKRTFQLPDKVNHGAIEAEYINGILRIILPKDERKIAKSSITIK
jgi:HSP20 family protein